AAPYVHRGGSSLQVLPPADDPAVAEMAAGALSALVADGRTRELVITKVDGEPVGGSPFAERLVAAGFVPAYRGLVLRAARGSSRPGDGDAARPAARGPIATIMARSDRRN